MGSQDDSHRVVSLLGPPTVVGIAALLLIMLPSELRIALTIWTLASFPIGVLFGHCVLNDD